MAKVCSKPLKSNPFRTYRDPATGRWIVIGCLSDMNQTVAVKVIGKRSMVLGAVII